MIIFDDIFSWEGWGGRLRLGSGKCRLRIFDLAQDETRHLTYLRPLIVLVWDIPESGLTVRSCAGHIATRVAAEFDIDVHRMMYVEFYRAVTYGDENEHIIPARFEAVEFDWQQGRALKPTWRELAPPLTDLLDELQAAAG